MKQVVSFFILLLFTHFSLAQMGLPIQTSLIPKNNLVVNYDFINSSSYTRNATSVTNLASTITGTASLVNTPRYMNSLGFISFNGSNQYLATPNLRSYFKSVNSSVQSSFTMSLWFYPLSNNGVVVSELDSQTPSSGFHAVNIEMVAGYLKFMVWPGTFGLSSSSTVALKQWHHVVMVYDGATLKAYVDGVSQGSQTYGRNMPSTSQNFAIGAGETTNLGSGAYGNFYLAQFKLHHVPLSDAEISREYNLRKDEFDYSIHSPTTNTSPVYWASSTNWSGDSFYANAPSPTITTGYHFTPWINSPQGWSAGANDVNQSLSLSYDVPTTIKGIVTQGREVNGDQYVTKAHIETSLTGSAPWNRVLSNAVLNSSTANDARILFSTPIFAKSVRVLPVEWVNHITMRMGMLHKPGSFTPSNLVLHYNPAMSESYPGTGTTLTDLSGNGMNGTMSNLTYSSPHFTYNGTNTQVSIPDNALLEPGTGSWSIEVWMNPSAINSGTVLGKYGPGGTSAIISYALRYGSNVIRADFSNGTTAQVTDNYTLALNTWVQMVYVWDKTNNFIYTYSNGALVQSKAISISGGILNTSTNLFIGSYNGGEYPQYFSGKIGIVRIYNKALSASEISTNFSTNRALYGL